MSGNAFAEAGQDPLFEVFGLRVRAGLGVPQPIETLLHIGFRKVADVMLKRIWHEALFQPYPGFAPMTQPLVSEQGIHQAIEIRVMRKEDVTADIPRESERIGEGTGEAAGMGRRFGEKIVSEAQLPKPVSDPQAGRTGADDQYPAIAKRWFRPHNSGLKAFGTAVDFDLYRALRSNPANRIVSLKNTKPDRDRIMLELESSLRSTYGHRVFPVSSGMSRRPTPRAPFFQ